MKFRVKTVHKKIKISANFFDKAHIYMYCYCKKEVLGKDGTHTFLSRSHKHFAFNPTFKIR